MTIAIWVAAVWIARRLPDAAGVPWWGWVFGGLGAGFVIGFLWGRLGRRRQQRLVWALGWLQFLLVIPAAGGLIPATWALVPLMLLIPALVLFELDSIKRRRREQRLWED